MIRRQSDFVDCEAISDAKSAQLTPHLSIDPSSLPTTPHGPVLQTASLSRPQTPFSTACSKPTNLGYRCLEVAS